MNGADRSEEGVDGRSVRTEADDFEGVNEFGTKVQRGSMRASSRMHSCGLRAVTAN